MSKGSKVVPVRMPADLLARIEADLALRNDNSRNELWSLSDYIRAAVTAYANKRGRSRGPRGSRRVPLGDEIVTLTDGGR